MGAEFIPIILIKNSCGRPTAAVLLCWAGGTRALPEQVQRLASLRAASRFSPRAGCFTGEFSHGHPTSSTPIFCLQMWAYFRGLGQGQGRAKEWGRRVWEQPASSELPPARYPHCQHWVGEQGGWGGPGDRCLTLTAHSPVQSDCPLVPWSSCQVH